MQATNLKRMSWAKKSQRVLWW